MPQTPRYLTKSRFKLARECPTKLFYTGKKSSFDDQSLDDPFLRALAFGGFQVGELAKIYYPGGQLVDSLDYDRACEETAQLLAQDQVTIYEAALRAGSLFVRVDILVKSGNTVKLIEVKSKSFDPSEEDPFYDKRALKRGQRKLKADSLPYLDDIAFQTFVAQQANPSWQVLPHLLLVDKTKKTSVEGLNQCFRLYQDEEGRQRVKVKAALDLASVGVPLLTLVAVSAEVALLQQGDAGGPYSEQLATFANAYGTDTRLPSPLGSQCKSCQFRSSTPSRSGFHQCWQEAAKLQGTDLDGPFVFDLWNFRGAAQLIADGTYLMRCMDPETLADKEAQTPGLSATARQRLQVEIEIRGEQAPYLDLKGLAAEFASLRYPLHFIDFETTMVAIPFHRGRRPYEQIAFQFSHHQLERDGTLRHQGQYINEHIGTFPNFDFLRALKRELSQDNGTIFRYAAHENTVLCQIYDQLEQSREPDRAELQDWITTVTNSRSQERGVWEGPRSMIDLCELVKRYYYHPLTKGSNSIKKVLPATLHAAKGIKAKYAQPIYGAPHGVVSLNFKDWAWIQYDHAGQVMDPYKLLPPVFAGIDTSALDLLVGADELADGGAAMMAYAKMQFTEMTETERQALVAALLKYCELDTFAMVFLYQYWQEALAAGEDDRGRGKQAA